MKAILLMLLFSFSPELQACLVADGRSDLLAVLLSRSAECPQDVRELKKLLAEDGLQELPAIVANRGRHNPGQGSFSIFESMKGQSRVLEGQALLPEHLYFGHFTQLDPTKSVALDQTNASGKLLIEVIAFDFKKGIYNFYELIGSERGPKWFYRGDSIDALEDNKFLKLGRAPQFGTKMRCSACHNSGGPIMKELAAPHNDWWTSLRKLPFGTNRPGPELTSYLNRFIDAGEFSRNVQAGMKLLERKNLSQGRGLREKLRPLFCTTEINLVSDVTPLATPGKPLEVPSAVFVDPLFTGKLRVEMRKDLYLSALKQLNSRFHETNDEDADHAFLAPIRGQVNLRQVQSLISEGSIDEEFVLDVLSIDFQNPLFSKERCALLTLVPESGSLITGFLQNLNATDIPSAQLLAFRLQKHDGAAHRIRALNYLEDKVKALATKEGVIRELRALDLLRKSVLFDEISKNPRGQILEPGFRVIFPEQE